MGRAAGPEKEPGDRQGKNIPVRASKGGQGKELSREDQCGGGGGDREEKCLTSSDFFRNEESGRWVAEGGGGEQSSA